MHFHPELGPPPTVGLEYEVTQFKPGKTYLDVSKELFERGMTRETYLALRHDWHHGCRDCLSIGKDIFFPVLWKLERDASLPPKGCEFISSPFPTAEMFVDSAIDALGTIAQQSKWNNRLKDQREHGKAEAGFHVHTYAPGMDLNQDGNYYDLMNVMFYYLPEMFKLSQSTGVERSLGFRLPSRDVNNHHSWIAFAAGHGQRGRNGPSRMEWRLWEAPVDDLPYLEGVIYLSAALSQLAHHPDVVRSLGKVGALKDWDKNNLSMEGILAQASPNRMKYLYDVVINNTHLTEDPKGSASVSELFGRVM